MTKFQILSGVKILAVFLLAMTSVDGGTFMDGGVYYVSRPSQIFSTGPAPSPSTGYSHPPIAIQFGSSVGTPQLMVQTPAPEEPAPVALAATAPVGDSRPGSFGTGGVSGGPAGIPGGTTGDFLSGGSATQFGGGGQTVGVSGGSAADQFAAGGQKGGLSGGSAFQGSQLGGGSAADQLTAGGQQGGLAGGSALQGSQMGGKFVLAAAPEPAPSFAAGPAPGRTQDLRPDAVPQAPVRFQGPYPERSAYGYGKYRLAPHRTAFYY